MEIIAVKPVTEKDIKEFEDLVYEYILQPDNWPREDFFFPPATEAIIRKYLFKNKATGETVGTGAVRMIEEGMARISYVCLKKKYQGLGLGRMMVHLLEVTAFKLGAIKLQLASVQGKEGFYTKLGYYISGEEKDECQGKVCFSKVLMKNLYKTRL